MASIAIIGDGPGGLSAALFLARNGQEVVVFGDDKTAMHYAHLNNYLGITSVPGSDFQATALAQTQKAGADIRRLRVTSVAPAGTGFDLIAEDSSTNHFDYVVLSEGKAAPLATALGLDQDDDGALVVGAEFRSSMQGVYVVGRSIRPRRSQAIISAGAGATAALDILAEITGGDVQDWDSATRT